MAAYLGIGASSGASASDIRCLADEVLAAGGVGWSAVDAVATSAGLAADPRLRALGRPVLGFAVADLGAVAGTHASPRALREIGTPSVAEAAALLAAGPGARLAVPKRRAARVTAALACR